MRSTHTYATLPVSRAAYDEIAAKLRAAGYDHAFAAIEGREDIDMYGIGLVPADEEGPTADDDDESTVSDRLEHATGNLGAAARQLDQAADLLGRSEGARLVRALATQVHLAYHAARALEQDQETTAAPVEHTAPIEMDRAGIDLHQTMDAQVWARTFMGFVRQGVRVDEELMLSWFANAFMCGWGHHARQQDERKTPDEWLQTDEFSDITVLDPDGWDRFNVDGPDGWNAPLTREEFKRRLACSTIGPRIG